MILLEKYQCINETTEQVVGLFPTLRNDAGKKPIALLAFQADLKGKFNSCGVCVSEGEAVSSLFVFPQKWC